MLSNVGHTIQKMINNTPVAIATNETTTAVTTNGGNVYQTGLISGKIRSMFKEIMGNESMIGRILDVKATNEKLYMLTASGSVFEYAYNDECNSIVREIYSPAACCGDKAVKIRTGRAHVVILTEKNKVWGAGSNSEYQLVPQGQCKYDTAVEIIVTDTNVHDNNCCNAFTGVFNELECPVIPTEECSTCNKVTCIKDNLCDTLVGYLNVRDIVLTPPGFKGVLSIPVFGDISYFGFLCIDSNNCASGTLTYKITKLYIKCGCGIAKFTYGDALGCHIYEVNVSITKEMTLFMANPCHHSKDDLCPSTASVPPISGTTQIYGKCGSCTTVDINIGGILPTPHVSLNQNCDTLLFTLENVTTTLNVLCNGKITGLNNDVTVLDVSLDVPIKCCEPCCPPKSETVLPQPCWVNVSAGHDVTALVDSCNRIYVLGSFHNVRSNKDLLNRSCLEELLGKVNTSISFPASQLNCSEYSFKDECCKCPKCRGKTFKTDLSKFGVHLSFPPQDECDDKTLNACEFLRAIKRCNEMEPCDLACTPCDGYVYLNVEGKCVCSCGTQNAPHIGSVTLFNKKSVCKLVSQGVPDIFNMSVTTSSTVEFDMNKYCVDNLDIPLEKIIKLSFCTKGPNVNLYVDISRPGGVKFVAEGKKCNVEFTVNASTQTHQFILNYGTILDPVELTNLKFALSLDSFFPCPKFKNPFDTKITNTYLKGGDCVRFVLTNPQTIRQAVTADIPTVFRPNRRVIDIAIGNNNLSVLVGGLACPNEVLVIGSNCYGELGIGSRESIICWKQLNRCIFDCQVIALFAGHNVTFYVTQSYRVYASGQWKRLVNSKNPEIVKSICQNWKIKHISISKNHIVLLGNDGCIFGLGDNSLGELGLCHLECVPSPSPLVFFYKLNNCVAKQLCENLKHPVERGYKSKYDEDDDVRKNSCNQKYCPNTKCCVSSYKFKN
ncbi:MAG: hypothetical protein QXW79_00665 [Thermoplasmata archaeon]